MNFIDDSKEFISVGDFKLKYDLVRMQYEKALYNSKLILDDFDEEYTNKFFWKKCYALDIKKSFEDGNPKITYEVFVKKINGIKKYRVKFIWAPSENNFKLDFSDDKAISNLLIAEFYEDILSDFNELINNVELLAVFNDKSCEIDLVGDKFTSSYVLTPVGFFKTGVADTYINSENVSNTLVVVNDEMKRVIDFYDKLTEEERLSLKKVD